MRRQTSDIGTLKVTKTLRSALPWKTQIGIPATFLAMAAYGSSFVI